MQVKFQTAQNSNKNNIQFGRFSQEAKTAINKSEVRTILKKQFKIDSKQIRQLDESPLKFSLLSHHIQELDLSENAGLMLLPPKGSELPNRSILLLNSNLETAGPSVLAKCVALAKKMDDLYKKCVKQFASHPINKAHSEEISKLERPAKVVVADYVKAYNTGNYSEIDKAYKKLLNVGHKEILIDNQFATKQRLAQKDLIDEVVDGWNNVLISQ